MTQGVAPNDVFHNGFWYSRSGVLNYDAAVPLNITIAGTPATLTNPIIQTTNSVDNYTQVATQNKAATANASADHVCYPDNVNASDATGFIDMGVTSSGYAQAAYACTGPNDAYLFGSAPTGSGKNGNLVIWTDSTGNLNEILFGTNGFGSAANERMRIKKNGQVRFVPLPSAPSGAQPGDVYYDSVANKLKVFTGSVWETVTSA